MNNKMLKGVMIDVSRNQVPHIKTLESIINILSETSVDFISLYIEHTYQYKKHPLIWRNTGAYSQKDIIRLNDFALKNGLHLIPSIQTLGHFPKVLKHKEYAHLAETSLYYSLSPALKTSYQLLEDMIGDIAEIFSSKYINIGLDEIWDIGQGKSKKLLKKQGVVKLFADHVIRVKKICEKYNKKIMIWGDMLVKHPDILKKIPKDIIVLNWNYSYYDKQLKAFQKDIDLFEKNRFIQILCPSTLAYSRIFPHITGSFKNSTFLLNKMKKLKYSRGAMITIWGDDGNYNFLGESLVAALYFAGLNKDKNDKIYSDIISNLWGIKDKKVIRKIEQSFNLFSVHSEDLTNLLDKPMDTYSSYWHDPWFLAYQNQINININSVKKYRDRMQIYVSDLISFKRLIKKNRSVYNELLYKSKIIVNLLHRIVSVYALDSFYSEAFEKMPQKDLVNKNCKAVISILQNMIKREKVLKKEFKTLWNRLYKSVGLVYNLKKYDDLIARYKERLCVVQMILRKYNRPGGGIIKKDLFDIKTNDYYDVITPIPRPASH